MKRQGSIALARYVTTMGMEISCLYLALSLLKKALVFGYPGLLLTILSYPLLFLLNLVFKVWPGFEKGRNIPAVFGMGMISAVAVLALFETLGKANGPVQQSDILKVGIQIGFCGFCCWLGSSLVRNDTDYGVTSVRFQIGLMALFLLSAVAVDGVMPVFVFFVLAALTLSLARWEGSVTGTLGVLRALRPRLLLLAAAGVVLLSACLLFVLSPDLARSVVQGLRAIGWALGRFFEYRPPQGPQKQIHIGLPGCARRPQTEPGLSAPPPLSGESSTQVSPLILWLVLFLIFLGVIFFVTLAVRKIKARRGTPFTGVRLVETFSIPGNLTLMLKGLLGRLVQRLWGVLRLLLKHVAMIGRPTREEGPLSATALYLRLLQWGARHDLPRLPPQTPLEYLKPLSRRFPDKAKELGLITDTYMQTRYSRTPAEGAALEAASEAWRKIQLE